MKKPLNVLIFPAGIENGLEIFKALRGCKEVRLHGASSPEANQAFYVFEKPYIIRDVRTDGWLDDLNKTIRENDIDIVFPANSTVIDHLSPLREKILAPVLLPEREVIDLTRSKKSSLEAMKGLIPIPDVYSTPEKITSFPAFAKPDMGYGSQGITIVENLEQAKSIDFDNFIVQQYLPGKEYSVDCFSNMDGKLLFSGARERSRIRMGTSMHAEVVPPDIEKNLRNYAEKILEKIKITGAWFFQVKEDDDGILRLLEIDIRIAGTMCFNRGRGINFPLLSILQFNGMSVSTLVNDISLSLDRCLKNRYRHDYQYDSVYVDLDDTLVIHDHLNTELIQFLYQCINKKKKIVLISKHLGSDINAYLKKWRISEIFDEIIWLKESDSKANYIPHQKAIFIEDSFSQRLEVSKKCGVPTFDPSMVEVLLDDRI